MTPHEVTAADREIAEKWVWQAIEGVAQETVIYGIATALATVRAERDRLGAEMLKWSQTARELRVRVTALEAELQELREQ